MKKLMFLLAILVIITMPARAFQSSTKLTEGEPLEATVIISVPAFVPSVDADRTLCVRYKNTFGGKGDLHLMVQVHRSLRSYADGEPPIRELFVSERFRRGVAHGCSGPIGRIRGGNVLVLDVSTSGIGLLVPRGERARVTFTFSSTIGIF